MHVENLLGDQDLGLRTLWAEGPPLRREISGVTVTDLEDPARFVRSGEAVLSGLVWWSPRDGEHKADRFVRALRAADAAVLLAGEETHGTVPDALIEACVRHRLPLAGVPPHVMFRSVTESVYLQQWGELSRRNALPGQLRDRLGRLLAQGAGPDAVLDAAFAPPRMGVLARVVTGAGRVVAGAPWPTEPPAGGAGAVVAIEADGPSPYERWELWLSDAEAAPPQLLHEVAAVLARCQEALARRRAADRRAADELGALLAGSGAGRDADTGGTHAGGTHLGGADVGGADVGGADVGGADVGGADVGRALRACGLPADGPYRVLVAAAGARRAGAAEGALAETVAWADAGPAAVGRLPDGTAFAVVAGPLPAEAFAGAWARVSVSVPDGALSGGTGTPAAGPHHLPGALAEARYALGCASGAAPGAASLVDAAALGDLGALLAGVPASVRAAYSRTVLGPLFDARTASAAALLETLRAFLTRDGSWARTAEALHLHVNTVHYRVRRIEHFTGRDLSRLSDRLDLWTALMCREE
ncbi:PucR family transcriptional regulator [Streptomyces sp. NPDC088785]|uniref:PucR family transcriptional regulator n=1 Tax=Streptomyces sp. NPDC088785 TaxID=3365897 RepID=UPI0037FF106D